MTGTYIFRGMVLPHELQESINNYLQYGIPTGGFLQAVIDNDLAEAIGRADEHNLPILPAIVGYLYNEAEWGTWGFAGAHDQHVRNKINERKQKAENQ